MTYEKNAVYSYLREKILTEFPTAYVTGKFVPKPPSFPAVYIHEIDRFRPLQNIQLDYSDVQWESVMEVRVVSVLDSTAMSEAYNVMRVAEAGFNDLYYREFSETNIDGGDIFTLIGRFRRVIGGGDIMKT